MGHIIPVPGDAGDGEDDDPLASLKTALAKLNGGLTLLESTASGWDEDVRAAPKRDWQPQRFGADPPEHLVDLRSQAAQAVLAACGVPVALVSAADGTAQREAYRRFVMAALEPAAACLAEELSAKLEVDLSFDFGRLWAHDLAGRAQVFERLTRGKVPMERALRLAGIG